MERAIALSRRGFPAPNPHVGCVLVKDGLVVGEGYHRAHGELHAEAAALQAAGAAAKGSTAYVTLEPCNHFGRQPPCSQALIEAGVRRVVYAVPDPNPKAAGGTARLRAAGIDVTTGVLSDEAEAANLVFLTAVRRNRPFVTLKAAIGLDGRLALPDGRSQWITGDPARLAGMRLRAEMGSVLVGARTALHDDPRLTARLRGVVNQPLRAILAEGTFEARDLRMAREPGETIVVTGSPVEVLKTLRERGAIGVLVEGGAKTHAAFLEADLVDRIELFVAPRILGDGPIWTGVVRWPRDPLGQLPSWQLTRVRRLGEDIQLTYRPRSA